MATHEPQSPARHQQTRALENRVLLGSLTMVLAGFLLINTVYVTQHWPLSNVTLGSIITSQQKAKTNVLSATIDKISENSQKDPAFTLEDHETMLIMDLSITNNTSIKQDFIPSTQLFIRTPGGDYRTLHPSSFMNNPIFAGTLNPGQTVTGQISFGIPKSATKPLLYIDTSWQNETPTVFDVFR